MARYWSKIAIFSYHLAFDAPVRGEVREEILSCHLVRKKLEWCGYPTVKTVRTCTTVSTEYRRVTDGIWIEGKREMDEKEMDERNTETRSPASAGIANRPWNNTQRP